MTEDEEMAEQAALSAAHCVEMRLLTGAAYFDRVVESGWTELWSTEQLADRRRDVLSRFERDPASAFIALADFSFSLEGDYGESEYRRVLSEMAHYAHGHFAASNVTVSVKPDKSELRLSFDLEGVTTSEVLALEDGYFCLGMVEVINRVLLLRGFGFIALPAMDDGLVRLAFVKLDVFASAARLRVLPNVFVFLPQTRAEMNDYYGDE